MIQRSLAGRARAAVLAVLVSLSFAGCSVTMPADPHGTLDQVSDGVLRVGVTPNGDRVVLGDEGDPSGADVEIVEDFAASIDAEIEWVEGAEEAHVRALDAGELDLVIGGLTDKTPWTSDAGMTRPYAEVVEPNGEKLKLVMLIRMGENAFLSELETFLTERRQEKGA